MQELAKYESAEREVQRLQWIIMENESNDEKEILKSHFEVVKANVKAFVREMLQASDKERALEVVKKVRRTSEEYLWTKHQFQFLNPSCNSWPNMRVRKEVSETAMDTYGE
ncbi:unnamed protein product [Arabidopsis lyrata]|uniref:Predicted protein n=1 Tax=Arabidopsis lyrata subsp. lyrata TaxID=81972 RepID=D7KSR5_ARALL|nr:predicted protein [Arabidopsis lyrata subsp. lyrata]CAH8255859.1 unnamed protein product [Arabidopsis lyrata]